MRGAALLVAGALVVSWFVGSVATQDLDEAWLSWSKSQAESIGKQAFVKGRVGGRFDTRLLKTERSFNYKLAATWMTPDVVRATARIQQLNLRLDNDAARQLVSDAEAAAHTVVMVEIDPREGAGVIPLDWLAFLQFDGGSPVSGTNMPELRKVPALGGVLRRNYDYDRFWVGFSLVGRDGTPLMPANATRATLTVRIHDKEGRVEWVVSPPMRARVAALAASLPL